MWLYILQPFDGRSMSEYNSINICLPGPRPSNDLRWLPSSMFQKQLPFKNEIVAVQLLRWKIIYKNEME